MGCMNAKGYEGPCKLCGYSDNDPCIPTYLLPKTFLNERYIVGKLISYNGEGAIYIGYDTVTGNKITIKEFMPDTLCARRKGETETSVNADNSALYKTYMSEFADLHRSLIKLRGMAHIQSVLDVFYENGTCYAVSEFINGITLKTYLENSGGSLSWEQVKELFPPILTTLSLIHAAGIIHRGISPQTIFVTDKMELKLAGFCISAGRTTNTEIACEIFSGYAAPEQYSNEVNGTWTDVYGISAVLYKVLTGTAPAEAIARTPGSLLEPMMINRNIPQNVSKVIMGGMRLSTDKRIRSITEFVDRLFAPPKSAEGGSFQGVPMTKKEEKILEKKKKERFKTLLALILVGAGLILFALAFALTLSGVCAPGSSHESTSSSSSSSIPPLSSENSENSEDSEISSGESSSAGESSSTVSEPIADTYVPDFTDAIYELAVKKYEGTFVFVPTYVYSDEFSAGIMFDQSVEAGTMVARGEQIKIKVSKGPGTVALPDYTGKTEAEYVQELADNNIKYDVKTEKSNEVPTGTVLRCSKEIGDTVIVETERAETVIVYIAENYEEGSSEPQNPGTPVGPGNTGV